MPGISFRDCWIRDDVFALPANVSFSFSQFIDNYAKLCIGKKRLSLFSRRFVLSLKILADRSRA